jgi:diguanylate cyclase (GGDEF)-like protein/PAS domain S-box-containing protein
MSEPLNPEAAPERHHASARGAAAPAASMAPDAARGWDAGALRVRIAMYAALAAIALGAVLGGAANLRLEDERSTDARILEQAAAQRAQTEQVGRLGLLLATDGPARASHAQSLQALLAQARGDALQRLDHGPARSAASPPPTRAAAEDLEAWESARERLWYRAEVLLRTAAGASEADTLHSALALQAEIEPAVAAAQRLSSALRLEVATRGAALHRDARAGLVTLLVLLALLAVGVVEPTARSVRRHGLRLRSQATELRRLALVAEYTTALVMITDGEDRVVWANAAFTQRTGWSLAEALGQRPGDLLAHPQADAAVLRVVQAALQGGQGLHQEWLHRSRHGAELWLSVDLCPLRGDDGAPAGFVRVCTDTTARAQQQAKLQALWAVLPAGVVVQDSEGVIVEANRSAERLLGLSQGQMLGRSSQDPRWSAVRADGSPCPGSEHPAMRTLATGQALRNQTMGIRLPEAPMRWLMINTEPQFDSQGAVSGVIACFSDVTESRALQDRLSNSARTDALTALPNRAVVMERLQGALAHLRRNPGYGFAVLFMDFDRFKQVNDTLGHGAGDELLRQIARRLSLAVRPGDAVARVDAPESVAARLGGDEFVVVLDGVQDEGTAQTVAQRMLQELSEPYLLEGCTPLQSSVSIGIVLCTAALMTETGPTAEELLRNADTAMYEAKRAGRGRWVVFNDSMQERLLRALEVETDLRRALKSDELFVVYQPVVDLVCGTLVGVEAMVRWHHPQRGMVGPVAFIGIAEECGLIDAVGGMVLRKACSQFMQWQASLGTAAPRQLAVNLSRAQLEREGVVDEVRQVLLACGMLPAQLQLEVTESLAAQGELVQANLRRLKSLGVRLALDDFGTGYSSLACLHQLPVDTVKVDRSFVQHAETVEYHRVLIEATIRVARTLGMTTVAEGIETPGQAELMRQLACDRGQGYLFSRPLEAAELARWALAQAARLAEGLLAEPA